MNRDVGLLEDAGLVTTEKVGRVSRIHERTSMNSTTLMTPNELEIRVHRIFEAPRAQVCNG